MARSDSAVEDVVDPLLEPGELGDLTTNLEEAVQKGIDSNENTAYDKEYNESYTEDPERDYTEHPDEW